MNDATAAPAKVTVSYWIIAALSLIWNLFGAYDYVMTRMRDVEYLKMAGDPQVVLGWIDSMPMLAQIGWPVGVWGSVLGSVLLLVRSRRAALAFAVSLVGALVSFGIQMTNTIPAELDTTANKVMPLVILALIVVQWWWSRRCAANGLLR